MDRIDVHDLPEEEAELVAAFVEFLRRHKALAAGPQEVQEAAAPVPLVPFATWPLGVKGTLRREDIYEHL
jgi:hypothetical protein